MSVDTESFLKDLEDMINSAGVHANHNQSIAGRCLYCSCGSRAQLTPNALRQARERLRDSQGSPLSTTYAIVLDPGTDQEFTCFTTKDEAKADASLQRHLSEGKLAEKRTM